MTQHAGENSHIDNHHQWHRAEGSGGGDHLAVYFKKMQRRRNREMKSNRRPCVQPCHDFDGNAGFQREQVRRAPVTGKRPHRLFAKFTQLPEIGLSRRADEDADVFHRRQIVAQHPLAAIKPVDDGDMAPCRLVVSAEIRRRHRMQPGRGAVARHRLRVERRAAFDNPADVRAKRGIAVGQNRHRVVGQCDCADRKRGQESETQHGKR